MGILQAPQILPGQVGVTGAIKYMTTTDSQATLTTAGYLNNLDLAVFPILASDILGVTFNYSLQTNSGNFGFFTVSISNGTITLVPWVDAGNVLLPVTAGDIPVFNNTAGQIKDSGVAFSNATDTVAPLVHGTVIAGHLASYQNANGTIQDSGIVAANVQTSSLSSPDAISDLIWVDVPLPAASLASGGSVTIQASSGSKQYKVRNVLFNYSASGLSGGGGDRLVQITDGTTVYNNAGITAALLGTPVNTVWGGSGNPLPGTVAMNTSTAAGANLVAKYAGGTTDYTTGTVTISVLVQRVA